MASPPEPVRVVYVCLERMVPGSAAATHVGEICGGLRRRGFAVRLVAEHGPRVAGLGAQLRRYVAVTLAGAAALRGVDLLYMRAHFAGFPLALVARLWGKPAIQEVNGVYSEAFVTHPGFRPIQGLLTRMQRAQLRWAARIVAVTRGLADWAGAEAGHGRAALVRNGANTDIFYPDGPGETRARPYALFFGGLARWHGVEVMLGAARSPAWPAGTDLVIAGPLVDPSLAGALASLPPNAAWLGPKGQDEIARLARGAVACLVPTVDPGAITTYGITPLKLFEAMACGRPLVVSDFPGMADIVREGGCGIVVPSGDAEALARAVARLAADPDAAARMGAAGAALARERYSWDASAAETARLIEAVLTGSR